MAKLKKKLSYISVPSEIITSLSSSSLQSLLLSPRKPSKCLTRFLPPFKNPRFWFLSLILLSLLGIVRIGFDLDPHLPFSSPRPCSGVGDSPPSISAVDSVVPILSNGSDDGEEGFWEQPEGLGYRSCLEFSREYRRWSETVVRERRKYLMVVVSGGLNQQRNQIVDAVVIARILGAALVVPILQVNVIWGDER